MPPPNSMLWTQFLTFLILNNQLPLSKPPLKVTKNFWNSTLQTPWVSARFIFKDHIHNPFAFSRSATLVYPLISCLHICCLSSSPAEAVFPKAGFLPHPFFLHILLHRQFCFTNLHHLVHSADVQTQVNLQSFSSTPTRSHVA